MNQTEPKSKGMKKMTKRALVSTKKPDIKTENIVSRSRKSDGYRSRGSPADQILFLQRTAGNQAVQRFIKSGTLQAKLRIGQPGDKYEQEADRVADAVMRMPEAGVQRQVEPEEEEEETLQPKPLASQITPLVQVQRQEETEEEEEKTLNTKPLAEEITPSVQRQVEPEEEEEEEIQPKSIDGAAPEVNLEMGRDIQSIKGKGHPLSASERAFFEPRFGADFDDVRVHTDAQADILNRELNARAFAVSQDIFFRQGAYSPSSLSSRELLAHELTHVVQQLATTQFIARQVTGVPAAPQVNAVVQNVWNAHPGIHAHFGNEVLEFERQTQEQWDDAPRGVRIHFNGIDAINHGYRRMYPAYFNIGISNPAEWIRVNINDISFLGDRTNVHQDLVPLLNNIQDRIRAATGGGNAGVNDVQGFVPRFIRGGRRLSHHAVGRAVDLNPDTNVRFYKMVGYDKRRLASLFRVIEAVTGVDLTAVTDWATQRNASRIFQSEFYDWKPRQHNWLWEYELEVRKIRSELRQIQADLPEYKDDPEQYKVQEDYMLELQEDERVAVEEARDQKRLVKDIKQTSKVLDKLAGIGFLDLEEVVVQEFEAEGFTWGGTWAASKDYMHFQIGALGP